MISAYNLVFCHFFHYFHWKWKHILLICRDSLVIPTSLYDTCMARYMACMVYFACIPHETVGMCPNVDSSNLHEQNTSLASTNTAFKAETEDICGSTAMEKEASPRAPDTLLFPKGLPSCSQIAGMIIHSRLPMLPDGIRDQIKRNCFDGTWHKQNTTLPAEHVAITRPSRCLGGLRILTTIQPRIPPIRNVIPRLTGINHLEKTGIVRVQLIAKLNQVWTVRNSWDLPRYDFFQGDGLR